MVRLRTHHEVLGNFATLHRSHRRQGQLATHVACCINVAHVGLAVTVDVDVAARVELDTSCF